MGGGRRDGVEQNKGADGKPHDVTQFESIGFHGEHNIKEILLGLRVFAKTRYRGEDDVKV